MKWNTSAIRTVIFVKYLVTDIGCLGQTSKSIRGSLFTWVQSSHFIARIVRPFTSKSLLSSAEMCGYDFSLLRDLPTHCHQMGLLLKKLTTVIPTDDRIRLYQQVVIEMRRVVLKKWQLSLEKQPNSMLTSCLGKILQTFIAGWDGGECCRIYIKIAKWFKISESVSSSLWLQVICVIPPCCVVHLWFQLHNFMTSPFPQKQKVDVDLRSNIKGLFLDHCETDRATWIDVIFNKCPVIAKPTASQKAKLALLLYAPVRPNGIW